MKKIILLFICLFISFIKVEALCEDNDLNEWAVNVKPTFTYTSDLEDGKYGYSYFLSISPYRDDVVIKVVDGEYSSDGQMFGEFYGVGCYTNIEEKTYKILIYGGDNSKCKGELLKQTTYTVPRFNSLIKEDVCQKYPDSEYCAPFTDKTKDMTKEEFTKAVTGQTEEPKEDNRLKTIVSYLLYIIIPFIIISLIYLSKKKNIKKKGDK